MKPAKYIFVTIAIAAYAVTSLATEITRELNAYRSGDRLEMQQISVASGKIYEYSALYDFSGCELTGSYRQTINSYNDSLISVYENRTVSIYDSRGDSLLLLSYRQPGINLKYFRTEAILKYPFSYGDMITGHFYAEGTDGAAGYLRHSGHYDVRANGRGIIITPEGDTIPDVLMTTYSRYGSTVSEPDFSKSYHRTKDSGMISTDSINRHLETDSITHRIMRQCWYASGYRYPIIDIRHHYVYFYGVATDSTMTALYYSPTSQKYDLPSDPENDIIRQDDYFNRNRSSGTSGNYSTKSSNRSFTPQMSDNGNNTQEDESDFKQDNGNNENTRGTGDILSDVTVCHYCKVSPTVTATSTSVRIGLYSDAQVKARLLNSDGRTMWSYDNTLPSGTHNITCDMTALSDGNYLMVVSIGDELFSKKLIKR